MAVLVAAAAAVEASGPTFWVVDTPAQLLQGTSDGVLIDRDGVLAAGPQLTNLLTLTPAQVWSLAVGPDGTVWGGLGGEGRVIRIRPGQPEETVLRAEESNVFAVAANAAGTHVYAATSPDGRVYAIDGPDAARPFFDPQEKYIWALAFDDAGGLWVGAGTPAVVYRVDAAGAGQAVYHPPASHVVSLASDGHGQMLVGTESPGRLYRLDAAGHPFALLDSGLSELRAIAVAPDGTIYAAAVDRGDGAAASDEATSIAAAAAPAPSPLTSAASDAATPPPAHSIVFKIDPTGSWEPFWETSDLVYDIALQSDGSLLAATGPEGRLYTIEPDRKVLLHTGVDAKQITRLVD